MPNLGSNPGLLAIIHGSPLAGPLVGGRLAGETDRCAMWRELGHGVYLVGIGNGKRVGVTEERGEGENEKGAEKRKERRKKGKGKKEDRQ